MKRIISMLLCMILLVSMAVPAMAAVSKKPAIVEQPQNMSVVAGKEFKVAVKASGNDLTYQWQVMKDGTSKWVNLAGKAAKTATYAGAFGSAYDGAKMRCVIKNSAGKCTSNAIQIRVYALEAPKVQSLSRNASNVTIKWTGVQLINNTTGEKSMFAVYRKVSGGKWAKIGETDSLSFVDKKAASGTKYFYAVKAISKDEKALSVMSASKSIMFIAAPQIKKIELSPLKNAPKALEITWSAVEGAEKYEVQKKNDAGKWVSIGKTTKTSFHDTSKDVVIGESYSYRVRCVSADGKTVMSANSAVRAMQWFLVKN